jgi:imidazolonepropionase-like amidohydrolase
MLLTNARVIDGTGRASLERASIHVADGRIVEVGDVGLDGAGVEGAVDLAGRTLMPGLIDAHAHLSSDISRSPGFGPPQALHGELPRPRELGYFVLAKTARVLLAAGITTVRDVGSYDDEAIALREAVRLGIVEGPRILSCGRIISATAPGGAIFGTMYREADGPDGMRRAVREQLRRGADYVKLMATGARSVLAEDPEPAQMTRDELGAIVDEAHRLGVRVAAHVEGLAGARLAVSQGVDTIEHGLSLHREPALLAAYATLAAARDAGVTIAMGHDSGPPGDNAVELARMVDGGLTPLEGVCAATYGSATALGLSSELGTVVSGSLADLVVVDGNPLADVRMLCDPERIWMVVQGGKVVAGRSPRVREPVPA